MQVAVIATDSSIGRFLSAAGFTVMQLHPDEVPSLTALLFDHPEIFALVIQDSSTSVWSASHVLAAAKHLERNGPTILLGEGKLAQQCGNATLIHVTQRVKQLPDILRRKPKATPGGRGITDTKTEKLTPNLAPVEQSPPLQVKPQIRPIRIPPGKILMLGVIGSQHRIGCTTQAIGLWHYCKALGFDPAVVSTAEQISQIAGVMNCKEIDGGYLIEGVPFVADTALAYDCYILDIGAGSIPEAKKLTDYLVLVAGSKPWELQHTAAALRAAQGRGMGVLLSFTSQKDANTLQPLFGGLSAAVVPWMTELWQPCLEAMLVYDALLRPVLEQIMARDDLVLQDDIELELIKGED